MELITGENDKNRRLDRILRKALPDYPLPLIHKLIRQKRVMVNGKPGKAQDRLDCGDSILIPLINQSQNHSGAADTHTKKIDCMLCIIWEECGLLAVNKPAGLSVHGPQSLDTLVSSYLKDKLPPSLSFKPGPLHRLDKPTSGIVVFSASIEGGHLFSTLLRERRVKKTYLAIAHGRIDKDEIWQDELYRDKEKKKTYIKTETDKHIETVNKPAITKITPLAATDVYSLITAEIETGRTHQIRAQAAFHGHPLAGDVKYGGTRGIGNGKREQKASLYLHAWKLEFLEYSLKASLPRDFSETVKAVFKADLQSILPTV
ncbi:MAG: RluA family pseudouridine synthase [Treponema sp.]|nr:RluA family pseudouridine synthase [Treponema sp.]